MPSWKVRIKNKNRKTNNLWWYIHNSKVNIMNIMTKASPINTTCHMFLDVYSQIMITNLIPYSLKVPYF